MCRFQSYIYTYINKVNPRRRTLHTDLLRLQVADDGVYVIKDLVNEGHDLADLHLNKMPPALLSDLDEGVARHVLHAVVRLCGTKRNPVSVREHRVKAECEASRSTHRA